MGEPCATNLNATDFVLPHSYFSSSSVFLMAVWGRRLNELRVLKTITNMNYGSLCSWSSIAFPRLPCASKFWAATPPAFKLQSRWGGGAATRPLGSSPFSLQDQRHGRPTIVLRSFKNISLLQPTTGNWYHILSRLQKNIQIRWPEKQRPWGRSLIAMNFFSKAHSPGVQYPPLMKNAR